jgi:hypothetical protein
LPAPWAKFIWDAVVRQYRAVTGKFVPRTQVRQALDEAIDKAREELVTSTRLLQLGALDIGSWQLRVEGLLKTIHTMSAAVAAGGWAQATAADWSVAATRIKAAYAQVEKLARRLEAGVYGLDDGRLVNWMSGLGAWGSGTYEAVLRRRDLATGRVTEERRLNHSGQPCTSCLGYHALGWQPPRTLPDIGTECLCGRFCRCTFQRRFEAAARADATDRARPRSRTPISVPGVAARPRGLLILPPRG